MMSAIRFIQDGGFFMYPILLIMFVGLGMAVERPTSSQFLPRSGL